MNETLERRPVKGHRLFFEPELDNGNITLITRSGNTVGSIWWAPKSKSSIEIETLWISDPYQNRGLGEALLREFLKSLPSLYPQAKYITGNATSQGIVRLLSKVLGEPVEEPDTEGLPERSPQDWRETRNRAEIIFRLPQSVSENEDDADAADFQRELRIANPEEALKLLNQRFQFDDRNSLWVVLKYSDFSGTTVDRANGMYLLKTYPNVFSRDEGRFNEEIIGISPAILEDLNPDIIIIVLNDLDRAKREPLDPQLWHQLRMEKQIEAWEHWGAKNFVSLLERKFQDQADAILKLDPNRLHALFETARDAAGIEWTEESGGDQNIDLDPVVNAVTPRMIDYWIRPQPRQESFDRYEDFPYRMNGYPALISKNTIPGEKLLRVTWFDETDPSEPVAHVDISEDEKDALLSGETLYLKGVEIRLVPNTNQNESLMEGREYSCVMAPAPPEMTDAVIRWGNMFVPDKDLYRDPEDASGFGREDEVHVTVKFGLHEEKPGPELMRIIEETQPFEIEVGPCTLFENEKFDVVKFDVDGDGLRELNRRVSELPNSDEYPDYHPHMTVAYVNKGTCNELAGKPLFDPELDPDTRYIVKAVEFSSKNKEKTMLFLGKPNGIEESEEEFDQELAKELHNKDQKFKNFTDQDVDTSGQFPRLYLDRSDLINCELWWQKQRLQKTASGYGAKIETSHKIVFNGRLYRIYVTNYGNAGSAWFIAKGRKIYIN